MDGMVSTPTPVAGDAYKVAPEAIHYADDNHGRINDGSGLGISSEDEIISGTGVA